MARKRYSDEDILRLLREIEVHLSSGKDVPGACRAAGISDATYKMLTVLDEYTRQALCVKVRRTMGSADVLEALYPLLLQHGTPEYLRSDNGPEFIAAALQDWLTRVGIRPIQIYPGSPWENGYNERFNGTLRREVLNAEWFTSTKQVQIAINQWFKQYNHIRTHQALGMRPPVPETPLEFGTGFWGCT